MLAFGLTVILAATTTAALDGRAAAAIPRETTPAAALSTPTLAHTETLRIVRDFGKPDYQIAVDAWRTKNETMSIADVRLWWVRTSGRDERQPFSPRIMKYLELDFEAEGRDRWDVTMVGDKKQFEFTVELDENGRLAAYVDVLTARGTLAQHCRATRGRLIARRFIGIPVGIERLEVDCVDPEGQRRKGELPYRETDRGRSYRP